MLTPCEPICVCPNAPCEQCMFGYMSKEAAHNLMKELIIDTYNGKQPNGWKAAKKYIAEHPDWLKEMGGGLTEIREKTTKTMKKIYHYYVTYTRFEGLNVCEITRNKPIQSVDDIRQMELEMKIERYGENFFRRDITIIAYSLLREEEVEE